MTAGFASLREFIRNAIVNEFAGAEPSEQVLDALVSLRQGNLLPARIRSWPRAAV